MDSKRATSDATAASGKRLKLLLLAGVQQGEPGAAGRAAARR